MKLTKLSRGTVASTIASMMTLGAMLGLTACARDYTVAYLYMTGTNKGAAGSVTAYAVDYQTGSLVRIGNPTPTGINPVTAVVSPNGLFLYVVNHDDSTVQVFSINTDGTLATKATSKITGTFPTAAAIDSAGKFLYVTYTYQTGFSATTPGPGGVSIFPVNADNSLGTPSNVNVGNNPVGVATSNFNSFVYVLDQEISPNATVLGFAENTSTGALTVVPGTVITTVAGKTVATGYPAGTTPSAIAEDPSSRFVYVTDQATNQLYGKVVQSNGSLVSMVNGPFTTGVFPVAITVDPRAKYLYVANFNSSTVSAYAIDQATGTPAATVGSTGTQVKTGPTCLTIEPALGIYLYTSNSADGTVSGMQLDPHNGGLATIQNSPFPGSGSPSCVAAAPNGQHATQIVQP
jgi:6-phosphogluconolactonase (cycloisomerase 2 family)